MCGIVGCAGNLSITEESLFKHLLIVDSLRGMHSTGILSVDSEGVQRISKELGDPFVLFDRNTTKEIFTKNNRVLIGHNRYATQGKINRANAHPFEFRSVAGVHNGTLKNKYELTDGNKFDVDSEALYHTIDVEGIEKAIPMTEGAYALVYYDNSEETLNIIRNRERPLFFIRNKKGDVIFWASEAWMLTSILNRRGYDFGPIEEVKEDHLYTFSILQSIPKEPLPKPRVKVLKGKTPAYLSRVRAQNYKQSPHLSSNNLSSSSPPKSEEVSNTSEKSYVGSEDVEFVVKETKKDHNNSQYVELFDGKNPESDVRLYFHNIKEVEELGERITATVSSMNYYSCIRNATHLLYPYFKVSPWTVKNIDEFIPIYRGQILSKEEFEKHHSVCSFCSSDIEYGEECLIYEQGALCMNCVNDEEIMKYIPKDCLPILN